jgi:Protein of unknown function (DUF3313)
MIPAGKTSVASALLAFALIAAPAGAQDKDKEKAAAAAPQNSGFLGDYARLTPAADNANTKLWVNKDFDFKPYTQIVLDPVEVWVSPTSEYKGISADVLKKMTDDFTASFKKALQSGYQFVEKQGPGVLHIRLAITGVNLVKPSFKPTDALPIVFLFRAASGASSEKNVVLTGEMQVLDPENNVVAAALSNGTSDKTIAEKKQITWKDMQSITDAWAAGLRRRLDNVRGIAPKS